MSPEELVAIHRRDSKIEYPTTAAERDRRALLQELDRVRDLWEQCRNNCFDKTVLTRTASPPGDDRH
jgi:hypothetical protein